VQPSTGVITVTDASGVCAISASKAGDDNYLGPITAGPNSVSLGKAVPKVNVTWAGKVFNGSPHPASANVSGVGVPAELIGSPVPAFVYYNGSSAAGTPLSGPPVKPGDYTVRANFGGNNNYTPAYTDRTITITYNFSGFFRPVDNASTGILNRVKAGSSMPVKFSLNGYWGLNVLAAGYPRVVTINCTGVIEPIADTELETGTANNGLVYDATADQYNYVWKTTASMANSCRQFQLRLTDGTEQIANFQFTK
jgi:hypothetical protein